VWLTKVEQTRLFVKRFPSEFRLAAMAKFVMPHNSNRPFVCAADGLLPTPCLSTINALKWLAKNKDKWLIEGLRIQRRGRSGRAAADDGSQADASNMVTYSF
jgi:hypothetical protein